MNDGRHDGAHGHDGGTHGLLQLKPDSVCRIVEVANRCGAQCMRARTKITSENARWVTRVGGSAQREQRSMHAAHLLAKCRAGCRSSFSFVALHLCAQCERNRRGGEQEKKKKWTSGDSNAQTKHTRTLTPHDTAKHRMHSGRLVQQLIAVAQIDRLSA